MKKSLTSNYIYMTIYQLLSVIVPIVTAPYLARALGVEGVGVYSYTYSIFNWVLLVSTLGISLYAAKEIAKVGDNKKLVSKTFSEIYLMQILFNLLIIILYYLVVFIFDIKYKVIYSIYGINLVANLINISWFYSGIEEFKKLSIRGCLVKALSVILILLLVKGENALIIYVVILSLSALISNIYLLFGLTKRVKINFKIVTMKSMFMHFKANLLLFIPQIAISIYTLLDQPMIGWLSGSTDEVGFYLKAEQLVKMVLYVITTLGTIMMPRIANLHHNKDTKKVKQYLNKVVDIVLYLSIPMMFGIAAIAPFFVNWFLTPDFASVAVIMMVISPIIVFISLTNVIGVQYLLPTDNIKYYIKSVTLGAFINFFCNFILISHFKANGAAIGTVIAEFSVFCYQFMVVKKMNVFESHAKYASICFINGIVMFLITYLVGSILGVGVLTTVVQIVIGVFVYLILSKVFKIYIQEEMLEICLRKLHIKRK